MALESWKVVIDVLLMATVAIFTYKSLRTPNTFRHSRRLGELDTSLRMLIREASTAGATLNDDLIIRRQELEKLLQEIELTGSRLAQGKDGAFKILADLREFEQKSAQLRTEIQELFTNANSLRERLEEMCVSGEMAAPPVAKSFEGAIKIGAQKGNRQRADTTVMSNPLSTLIEKEITVPYRDIGGALSGIDSSSRKIITQANDINSSLSENKDTSNIRHNDSRPIFETRRF